jgi:uncharacterized protein (TIGR02598 family)
MRLPEQQEDGCNAQAHPCLPRPSPCAVSRRRRSGFTLVEVSIAILLMSVAVLGLLSLYRVGLRQSDAASSDTAQTAFADLVLNAVRANAQTITNWADWASADMTNGNLIVSGVTTPASQSVRPITVPTVNNASVAIQVGDNHEIGDANGDGYLIPGCYLKYSLHIENGPNDLIKNVWIQVTNRRYTSTSRAPLYATSIIYMGM